MIDEHDWEHTSWIIAFVDIDVFLLEFVALLATDDRLLAGPQPCLIKNR